MIGIGIGIRIVGKRGDIYDIYMTRGVDYTHSPVSGW